jgi:DNA-binding NarL/FixJ family response regulator
MGGIMSDEKISVFLVDDHVMVREGLAALVAKDPQILVVGQAGDGLEVFEQLEQVQPDVIVLDITLPGLNGLDVCREITRKYQDIAVLILTMHEDAEFVARALAYGASGYLLKEAAADQLAEAVQAVARGELYLGPGIPKDVLQRIGKGGVDPYELLTGRERQVLQLVAEGSTNRQIAETLDVALKTVDTHRSHLMRKLNIHDQTSLVKYALRKGIVTLD